MTNNVNTKYVQKPIYEGLLEQKEYEAVLIKATPLEAKPSMPPSIRVMFKIDFPTSVAFVSGFMNQFFKSGDKTSTWLKNLGVVATSNQVPMDQLIGKRCKIYVTPGNKVWSQKYNKEIQYHKIMALTPASSVVPQVVTQQPQAVQQPQPVFVQPMTQQPQNNPFLQQAQTVQPVQQTYTTQGNSMAEQLAKVANQQPQPVQQVQPVQTVQQAVSQPLPVTPVSLDF